MVNTRFRWLIGGWIAAVAIILAASLALGASPSTTVLFVALGVTPGIVVALLAPRGPSSTVADILHPAETRNGRG